MIIGSEWVYDQSWYNQSESRAFWDLLEKWLPFSAFSMKMWDDDCYGYLSQGELDNAATLEKARQKMERKKPVWGDII